MDSSLLQTESAGFSEILGNGKKCFVPIYQREYSWEEENWSDLWDDIISSERYSKEHYLGAIVLMNRSDGHYDLIDGQQRLSTLTIFTAAIIKKLEELVSSNTDGAENKERIDEIKRDYIGSKNKIDLTYSSHLTLSENNNTFFNTHIINGDIVRNPSQLKDGNKLIYDCLQFFKSKISEFFHNSGIGTDGSKITEFLEKILRKYMKFILISVKDESSAYTVFETLNSKGVSLSTTDLLKNYIFSLSSGSINDLNHIKIKWGELIDKIGMRDFPDFLRYYIGSYQDIPEKKNLYREIKSVATDKQQAITLMNNLLRYSDIYCALFDSDDEYWNDFPENAKIKEYIKTLKSFGVKQYISVFFSGILNLDKDDIYKLFNIIKVITFRYTTIGGQNPKVIEKEYNKVAKRIFSKELNTITGIFNSLKDGGVYPGDEIFKSYFETKILKSGSNKSVIRYILGKIECHLSGTNIDYDTLTIEHIIPENPTALWKTSYGTTISDDIYRLGNYILLEKGLNSAAQDKIFMDKKSIYKKSVYHLKDKILEKTNWTPQTLKEYQKFLSLQASSLWSLQY